MPAAVSQTDSLCPDCLRRIPARRVMAEDGVVYLERSCPEHGDIPKVQLWNNRAWSYEDWNRDNPKLRQYNPGMNCPEQCGICSNHRQSTCTAILEVTHRCNLRCPVCFSASEREAEPDPSMDQIQQMLDTVKTRGICPLQLSGGEPTLRDDLPEIIALARNAGFDHVQVNTNGVRLAQDADYCRSVVNAGVTDFFLQFDGLDDGVYTRIRGTELLSQKIRTIEVCAELKVGVILVPTLVKGVNDDQVGRIIRFAKQWIPTVKGVHFQPFASLGRFPAPPQNKDRIFIPDLLLAIEEQTGGELIMENMVPPG